MVSESQHIQRRTGLFDVNSRHTCKLTGLTKSTEYRVCETVADRKFPLRSYLAKSVHAQSAFWSMPYYEAKGRREEKIGYEDIVGGYASPFHQAHR